MSKSWALAVTLAVVMNGLAIYSLSEQSRGLWLRVQILEAREVMGRKAGR